MTGLHYTAPDWEVLIDGLVVTANSPVLQRRELNPASAETIQSRFTDQVWDLFPALTARHVANQPIHWNTFPEPLRHACQLYIFALVNVIEHAPRMLGSRAPVPSITTIWNDLQYFRVFTRWLHSQGVGSFAEVDQPVLDTYYRHVMTEPGTPDNRRKLLLAVQRLHHYRHLLPEFCRFAVSTIWGGARASELATSPNPRSTGIRTPRIHPDVMEPLLSAAILVIETVAADLRPAAKQLVAMRSLAHQVAPDIRRARIREVSRHHATKQHLEALLPAFAAAGHPLPGRRDAEGAIVVDYRALALAGMLDHDVLHHVFAREAIDTCGMVVDADLLRVTQLSTVAGLPWRDAPVGAEHLPTLIRHITTACYLVVAYLSGIRPGEVLNLRRGCVTRDTKLGMIFLSGRQLKTGPDRAKRSPATIPWVINEQGAQALSILEDLAPGEALFPAGRFGTTAWMGAPRIRASNTINDAIGDFVDWFNTQLAHRAEHPCVASADRYGKITGRRLRRTLAWHIVRRPGGTIAGKTQYGHLFSQMTTGYAGRADAGFIDDITFEQFLLRVEQLHDDHQLLAAGEHVSGPAADLYRHRIAASEQFQGTTLTTPAQAKTALANPNLQIHHGELVTCVWRPETAACANTSGTPDGPTWPRCRLSCTNIARTSRDIAELRRHVGNLQADLGLPGLPEPIHQRISERIAEHEYAIRAHEATHPR